MARITRERVPPSLYQYIKKRLPKELQAKGDSNFFGRVVVRQSFLDSLFAFEDLVAERIITHDTSYPEIKIFDNTPWAETLYQLVRQYELQYDVEVGVTYITRVN